jgi:hypothetical protein
MFLSITKWSEKSDNMVIKVINQPKQIFPAIFSRIPFFLLKNHGKNSKSYF